MTRVLAYGRLVCPTPPLLDSGLRRNDEWVAGMANEGMKMGRRVSFFQRLVALPHPTPSGFRPPPEWRMRGRNDEGTPRTTNKGLPERSIPDRGPGRAFAVKTTWVVDAGGFRVALGRNYVRKREILAFEQKGFAGGFRQSIGEAITGVECRPVVAPAEPSPGPARGLGVFKGDRLQLYGRSFQ